MSHYNKEMVSFFLTTSCNLNCLYCYTNKEEYPEQAINIDFAKKLIEDYASNENFSNLKKVVRFFAAGEPTINFDAMSEIVAYAKELYGDSCEVELQTNGIFMTKSGEFDIRLAEWVASNIDYIWISCDGTPDIQNRYRPLYLPYFEKKPFLSSSEIVEMSIKFLTSKCKKMTGTRLTILNSNIYRQKEMIDYFYSLGIRDIWADPIFASVGNTTPYEEINLDVFAEQFLLACEYASSFGVDPNDSRYDKVIYGSNYTCNFDEITCHYCRACKPVPHATTDGFITSCDMAMFHESDGSSSAHLNSLLFGKWDNCKKRIEYDRDKMELLRERNVKNMAHCQNCEAKNSCGGYCLGEVTNETGTMYGAIPQKCRVVKKLYREMNVRQRKYRYTHP